MSWLEAVHKRPRILSEGASRRIDHRPERGRLERGRGEREIEGEVELLTLAVVAGEVGKISGPGLADQHTLRLVRIGDRPPPSQHLVHLRAVHAVDLEAFLGRGRVEADRSDGIVAQETVLHDGVGDVDPEAGDPTVEPGAEDRVERLAHVVVPPVQVRLLREEVVQVVLTRRAVEGPRGTAERAPPIVRRAAVGGGIGPDVPVPVLEPRARAARRGTTDADRSCGSARDRGSRGCRGVPPLRSAGREPRHRRGPARRRGSRRRRTPSRGSGSDAPGSTRWRRRRARRDGRGGLRHPSRSPIPSPSASWNERGYTW